MNILFWNINRKNLTSCLLELIRENSVDMLILAEYPYEISPLCQKANELTYKRFNALSDTGCPRIKVLICNNYNYEILTAQERYLLAKISTNDFEWIIAMIHGRSKFHARTDEQLLGIASFRSAIEEYEERMKISRTIAIGDFNIDPFEKSCFTATGMHSFPFRDVVKKGGRKFANEMHNMFYNPTWRLFGRTKAPYTSYYNETGGSHYFHWYAFDQIMIRHSLMGAFEDESLRIITSTKDHDFLSPDNTPNKSLYSDHLPLFCTIKEDAQYE